MGDTEKTRRVEVKTPEPAPAVDVTKREEKVEEKKPKSADRPHLATMLLSGIALIVSCLSFYESHSARLISQSANRAVAYVTELQKFDDPTNTSHPHYKIIVRNVGRSTAIDVHSSFKAWVSAHDPNAEDYRLYSENLVIDVFEKLWQDLPPGLQKDREVSIPWDKVPQQKQGEHTFIMGILSYKDESSGQWYRQLWCFRLDDERTKTSPSPCFKDY